MVLKKKAGSVYAFTLSEVLVALSIIGIIASITIPGILANAERSKFDNLFKKSYSNISEAIKRVTTNNGNVPLACYYYVENPYGPTKCVEYNSNGDCTKYTLLDGTPKPDDYNGNFTECSRFYTELKKNLSIVKQCAEGRSITDGCLVQYKGNDQVKLETNQLTNSMYTELDAKKETAGCSGFQTEKYASKETIVLNNGATLIPYTNKFNSAPIFAVDVNGIKKPNKAGYDLYFLAIKGDKGVMNLYHSPCGYVEQGGKTAKEVLLGY